MFGFTKVIFIISLQLSPAYGFCTQFRICSHHNRAIFHQYACGGVARARLAGHPEDTLRRLWRFGNQSLAQVRWAIFPPNHPGHGWHGHDPGGHALHLYGRGLRLQ